MGRGKLYRLPHVVLFAILAIVAGANSYPTIHSFIDVHIARLRDVFGQCSETTNRSVINRLVASSTNASSVHTAPRSSNQACSEPSICTNSRRQSPPTRLMWRGQAMATVFP